MHGKLAQAIATLEGAKSSTRCSTVKAILASLGFEVREGKAGHRVYVHNGLKTFKSSNYNCGHGKNGELKSAYVTNILRVLNTYSEEISEYIEGQAK